MDQRKKKIYTMLLVGGGVVLFVNFVLLPEEDTRRLAPVSAAATSLNTSPSTEAVALNDAIPELIFPRELPSWPPDGGQHDFFTAPYDSVNGASAPVAAIAGTTMIAGANRSGKTQFADNHHLQIVMDDKLRPIAVVNDQWLNLGDEIDQCKLLSVKGMTATFECFDGEILLELETIRTK